MQQASGSWNRRLALLSLASLATMALAQPASTTFEPQRGQAGKDVIWIPTPDAVVQRMLQMAEVRPDDRVFDLGAGDGKIAIAAARDFGARATGLEFNPDMVVFAQRQAQAAGVADKVEFRQADIFQSDFSSATVVTLYLLPALNLKLRPLLFQMAPGTRVVSHSFSMGDWAPDETARIDGNSAFLWRVPANASGTWRLSGEGLPGDTVLSLTQRYQVVSGSADFGELEASVLQPRLSGERLRFGLRTPQGELLEFDARVSGERMQGHFTRPGKTAAVPFEATRREAAAPIAGGADEAVHASVQP